MQMQLNADGSKEAEEEAILEVDDEDAGVGDDVELDAGKGQAALSQAAMSALHEIFDNGVARDPSHNDAAYKAYCVRKFEGAGREVVEQWATAPAPAFPPDAPIAHAYAREWLEGVP